MEDTPEKKRRLLPEEEFRHQDLKLTRGGRGALPSSHEKDVRLPGQLRKFGSGYKRAGIIFAAGMSRMSMSSTLRCMRKENGNRGFSILLARKEQTISGKRP